MALGLLAKKMGMTTLLDEQGVPVPVTVLEAGPCVVIQVHTPDTVGYGAIQVGFGATDAKRLSRPKAGPFAKAKVPAQRRLAEFRCDNAGRFTVGQQLTVAIFEKGDRVDVQGWTKGRGFQGVIKRHGKHGGPGAHGSHFHRTTGSIGMRTWPGRVLKNTGMPGQMGDVKATIRGLEVVGIDAALNLLFVRGGVPGAKNGVLRVVNRDAAFEGRCVQQAPGAPTSEAASEPVVAA